MIVICIVKEEVTGLAIKAIHGLWEKSQNSSLRIRATVQGMEFYTTEGMSENDRQSWENIIRGVICIM